MTGGALPYVEPPKPALEPEPAGGGTYGLGSRLLGGGVTSSMFFWR